MLKVQLLLVLALVGPFCVFTLASPTELPKELDVVITAAVTEGAATEALEITELPKAEVSTVVTGPPTTEPAAAPEEVATEVPTEVPFSVEFFTKETAVETEAAVIATTEAPAPLITEAPAVETAAPTEEKDVLVQPTTAKVEEDVIMEDGPEEGLSSGQVVGIVIGSLLAVVIVITVVTAVVRRMGKYSSAKNKKPAKKDSILVSPLRKKATKQPEHPKFWKF